MFKLSKLKNANITLLKNGKFLGFGSSPGADWEVIFIGATLLVMIMIGMGGYVFVQIDKGEIFLSEKKTSSDTPALDEKLLEETVSYYVEKAKNFEELKSVKVNSVDPSI